MEQKPLHPRAPDFLTEQIKRFLYVSPLLAHKAMKKSFLPRGTASLNAPTKKNARFTLDSQELLRARPREVTNARRRNWRGRIQRGWPAAPPRSDRATN
eukprot:418089-Pyramimonas_sp.AAC.1